MIASRGESSAEDAAAAEARQIPRTIRVREEQAVAGEGPHTLPKSRKLSRRPDAGCCIARSGKLDRARSRLYRSQILQENMRLKALAEIYTMHSFAQLCNLNFLSNVCPKIY